MIPAERIARLVNFEQFWLFLRSWSTAKRKRSHH